MTIEEIKGLIAKYGPSTRLQDLLAKMEGDQENLKTVLDSPVEGDQVVVAYYTWTFSEGKWSSRSWEGQFLPEAFKRTLGHEKILYIEKMMPR